MAGRQSIVSNPQPTITSNQSVTKKLEPIANKPVANANLVKKLEREVAEIEAKVTDLEHQMATLEGKMADPKVFKDNHAMQKTNSDYEVVKLELKKMNGLWEAKMLEMEG